MYKKSISTKEHISKEGIFNKAWLLHRDLSSGVLLNHSQESITNMFDDFFNDLEKYDPVLLKIYKEKYREPYIQMLKDFPDALIKVIVEKNGDSQEIRMSLKDWVMQILDNIMLIIKSEWFMNNNDELVEIINKRRTDCDNNILLVLGLIKESNFTQNNIEPPWLYKLISKITHNYSSKYSSIQGIQSKDHSLTLEKIVGLIQSASKEEIMFFIMNNIDFRKYSPSAFQKKQKIYYDFLIQLQEALLADSNKQQWFVKYLDSEKHLLPLRKILKVVLDACNVEKYNNLAFLKILLFETPYGE